jgi:hypothetical protein
MNIETNKQIESGAVPLRSAVLCIDCECVTNGLSDECLVCGSRSLFSLSRLLGGTGPSHKAHYSEKNEKVVLFDAEIAINLNQVEPRELCAIVEGIASLIAPSPGHDEACFHIDVEPVDTSRDLGSARAA